MKKVEESGRVLYKRVEGKRTEVTEHNEAGGRTIEIVKVYTDGHVMKPRSEPLGIPLGVDGDLRGENGQFRDAPEGKAEGDWPWRRPAREQGDDGIERTLRTKRRSVSSDKMGEWKLELTSISVAGRVRKTTVSRRCSFLSLWASHSHVDGVSVKKRVLGLDRVCERDLGLHGIACKENKC
jgi:hypothetical protein